MTVLVGIPHRDRLQVVLVLRAGLGWHVGVGSIATGRIDGEREAFTEDRKAYAAAIALADARDLIAVQG